MKNRFYKKSALTLLLIVGGASFAVRVAYCVPNGAGNEIFNTNVGIGTSGPQARLAVMGNVGIGTWAVSGGSLTINAGGNVGIGSAWPGMALDVNGTERMTGLNIASGASAGFLLVTNAAGIGTWMTASTVPNSAVPGGSTPQLQYKNGTSFAGAANSGVNANGNLGLGTTAPFNTLSIAGDVGIGINKTSSFVTTTASKGVLIVQNNIGIGTWVPAAALDVKGTIDIKGVNGISYPSSDTTANGSIAIGLGALASQNAAGSAAYGNTAVGYKSMGLGTMTTAAIENTAIGFEAMADLTSGYANTAVGYQAMENITSGTNNTAIGYQALQNVGIGSYNTAVGYRALASVTSASNDTAVGYEAGVNITTASNVSLFGYEAGENAGANSSALGTQAQECNSGQNNTAVGYQALADCTGSDTGSNNTVVGNMAGAVITTGSNNTILGYQVGSSTLKTGSNNILIGTSNAVDTTGNNTNYQLNIGNLLRGDMTNSTATYNTTLFLQSTNNGVDYLQVAGGASGNPGLVTISAQGTDANINLELLPKGSGSVGIGTTTCGFGSSIGGGQCRGYITTTGAGIWTVPSDWSSTNTIEMIGGGGGGQNGGSSSGNGGGGGGGGAYAIITNLSLSPGNSISYSVGTKGAGGSPGGTGGNTWFNAASCGAATACAGGGGGAPTTGAGGAPGTVQVGLGNSGGTGGSDITGYGGGGGAGAGGPEGVGGNGGTSAGAGQGAGGGGGGGGGSNGGSPTDDNGGAGGNNYTGNGSGAGGTSGSKPGTAGSSGGGGGGAYDAGATNAAGGNGGNGVEWGSNGSGGGGGGDALTAAAGSGGLYGGGGAGSSNNSSSNGANGAQGIIVITYNSAGYSNYSGALDIMGDVGIGTWAPGAALIVRGNVGIGTNRANYNLQIKGCTSKTGTTSCIDLAEIIPSSQALSAGDVVMLDQRSAATVMKAVNSDNGLLFGVVTSDPAIVMEGPSVGIMEGYDPDPMKPAIALAGRVPVKTNLENGAIAIGDMIGSSSTPGIGSKAIGPGRVIGMALEPLKDLGQDAYKDILVYVDPHWWPGQDQHHWTQVEDPQDLFDLALLCDSGETVGDGQDQKIKVQVCNKPSDPGVLGAWDGVDWQGRERIRASGTGYLIIANKGEDLRTGDYLMSSQIPGMAEKQPVGAYMSYTAAKMTENIHWRPNEKSRKAAVFFQVM